MAHIASAICTYMVCMRPWIGPAVPLIEDLSTWCVTAAVAAASLYKVHLWA